MGDEAVFKRQGSQPQVSVILPQQQPEFRAAGEHAVWFVRSLGNQVVNHDAYISLVPPENQRGFSKDFQGGVRSRDQALGGGFFITGSPVDLSGKIQVLYELGFQSGVKLGGWAEVVFHRIPRAYQLGIFQTGNSADKFALSGVGQGSGHAVEVEFFRAASLRFQKNLMARFFCKPHDFVFNGRAVARPYPFNDTAVQGTEFQIIPDNVVRGLVGVRDPAGHLLHPEIFVSPRVQCTIGFGKTLQQVA